MTVKNKTEKFRIIFQFLEGNHSVLCGNAVVFRAFYSMQCVDSTNRKIYGRPYSGTGWNPRRSECTADVASGSSFGGCFCSSVRNF